MRRARKERGLTQKQLADMAGVGVNTVNFIETGRTQGRIDTIEMLARALCMSIDKYTGYEVAPRKPSEIERFFGGK